MSEAETTSQPSKKKRHHGGWIALFIIVLVLGIGVGGIYFLFYDDSNPAFPEASADFDQTSFIQRKVVDAFSDTKDTGNLTFAIKEDETNQLLSNIRETKLDESAQKYFRGALANFTDNSVSLDFYIDTQVLAFKSKARAVSKFAETSDAFTLDVTDLQIGPTTWMNGLAKDLLQKHLPQSTVDSILSSTGLQMTFDVATMHGSYSKSAMRQDINKLLSAEESQDARYAPVVKAMLGHDSIHLTEDKDSLGLRLSLENVHTNANFVTPEKETAAVEPNFIADATKVQTLLTNGVVDNNTLHASYAYQLFGVGYDALVEEAKSYVDTLDLSSIGISDPKTVTGHRYASSYDLATNMTDSLTSLFTGSTFTVSEDDLSSVMQSSSLLGYGLLIPAKQEDGSWKTAWAGINAAYVNIFDNRMVINVGLDIAGYECYFIIDSLVNEEKSATLPYGVILDPQAVYAGTEAADAEVAQGLYTLIDSALESKNLTWLAMNPASGEITMDLSKAVPALSSSGVSGLNIAFKGDDLATNGKMEITRA